MKFAVLEYTSKSGNIWRHTDDQPNYLADPQREIDPTSFGCYVSALKGEHVPLTGLITGPVNPVSPLTRTYRKIVKRLTGSWPGYSLDYLKQFDVLLAVHQLSDAHELVRAIQQLKKQRQHPLIIGVPTQPYGLLRPAAENNPAVLNSLQAHMNACDIFLTVVKDTSAWYKSLTDTPVVYLPQPYPVEYAAQHFEPINQKSKTILVAGVTQRDNIIQGQLVARALQQQYPEFEILIPKVADLSYDFSRLEGSRYRVLPFEAWQEHLATLATTHLVINTDYTQTRGRVQTDCAAVGTPSLGGNSDGTRDLFPELASTPQTDTHHLIKLGARLITDGEFYKTTVHHAHEHLKKYNYEETATRLSALVNSFRRNDLAS